jgi:hypothetical protein
LKLKTIITIIKQFHLKIVNLMIKHLIWFNETQTRLSSTITQ